MAHTTLTSLFTDIADAIRAKTGGSATIVADNFPEAIGAIQTKLPTQEKTATPSTSDVAVTPDSGYALSKVNVKAVALNAAAGNMLSGTSATITSNGTTISTVNGTISQKAAATYNTSTSDQTISSGQYLKGAQTIKAVTTSNISAANVKDGVIIKVGDENDDDRIVSVTGTFTDSSTITGTGKSAAAAGDILSGKSAFLNGSQIDGTMPNATITSGAGSATISDPSYNSTAGNFTLTASGTVAAPSVGTAGYISSSAGTKNTNTVSGSKTLSKIVGSTAFSGTTTKAPVLKRTAKPTADTWTDAASGAVTTTKPTSGVYVQIDADANTGSITATPSITTAGYGTSSYHGVAGNSTTVGAAKATTAYVPITTTSASVSGPTVSYGSGWITAGSKTVGTGALAASASVTVSGSGNVNPGTNTISKNTNTNVSVGTATTTKPTSGYYFAADAATAAGSGSVSVSGSSSTGASATVSTAGYVTTSQNVTGTASASGSASVTVPAKSASTTYFPITTGAISVSGSVTTSGSGSVNPGTNTISKNSNTNVSTGTITTSKPSSGYYVAIDAATAAGSGSISVSGTGTAKATVGTAGYVTTSQNASGSVSGSGSASVTVNAKSASTTYLPIPTGTCTVAGAELTKETASGGGLSGGGLSITTNYSATPTVTLSSGSETNMSNIAAGSKDTSTYPYYFKVNGASSSLSGKTKATRAAVTRAAFSQTVSRAAVTDTHTAGYIPAQSATTVIASDSATVSLAADSSTIGSTYVEPTVTINAGSNSTYVNMKAAGISVAGGGLTQSGNSGGGLSGGGLTASTGECAYNASQNVTLTDTNNGIYVKFSGRGNVARAAVTRAAFSNTVTRAAVTDTRTAGYLPARSSTSILASGTSTVSLAADSSTIPATSAWSDYGYGIKYISGVTVPANVTFTATMTAGATLNIVDSINNKTWVVKTDSINNALTIVQA